MINQIPGTIATPNGAIELLPAQYRWRYSALLAHTSDQTPPFVVEWFSNRTQADGLLAELGQSFPSCIVLSVSAIEPPF